MSKYFEGTQCKCKCGCGLDLKEPFKLKLDAFREKMGFPLMLSSGARCKARNDDQKGAENSRHVRACAADIRWDHLDGQTKRQMLDYASKNFPGIGLHEDFLHVDDDRPNGPLCWFYPRTENPHK